MTSSVLYPLRVRGHVDPATSRWLWLVKWLLVIPHLLILAALWIAVVVTTLIAGFAILFTGRYPRRLFDFAAGVLRWTWRVSFYSIDGFATDRYPPFSLRPDPTYPAELEVAYPQHLSRGLVLVKWWLLALPQYVIVAAFAGGWANLGLIGVLAVIAAATLLFTGRYPAGVFDFLMGLNRWAYRVAAYAMLMTDEYPPFRLDVGGADPGDGVAAAPPREPVSI